MFAGIRRRAARVGLSLLAAAVTTVAGTEAQAALLVSSSGSGGIVFNAFVNGSNTLGFKFNVGAAPLEVSSLGFFDSGSDGLPSAIMVGLWKTSTAAQVAAVTVPAGTSPTLVNDYRFVSLASPVTLEANTSYTIGYRSASGGLLQDGRNRVGQVIAPEMSIPAGGFGLRHSFDLDQPLSTDFATQMPVHNLGDTVPLTGPNFHFTVVPEPAAAGAMAVGAIALVARRKRA